MDNRAIGVFDSGLGGLTAVKELHKILPNEHIIYFGDTGRVPYGTKGRNTILEYARQDVAFLNSHDIKAIVVACGTVSTVALPIIKTEHKIPIIGVVKPACYKATELTRNNRIGIIGTNATIKSGAYEAQLHTLNPGVRTCSNPCPLFVPLVENGRFAPDDQVVQIIIKEYLSEIRDFGVDTLILGCTHFPLLKPAIRQFMGDSVNLIDPGAEAADYMKTFLERTDAQQGCTEYYVSDDTESFDEHAGMFLGEPTDVRSRLVDPTAFK